MRIPLGGGREPRRNKIRAAKHGPAYAWDFVLCEGNESSFEGLKLASTWSTVRSQQLSCLEEASHPAVRKSYGSWRCAFIVISVHAGMQAMGSFKHGDGSRNSPQFQKLGIGRRWLDQSVLIGWSSLA